MDTYMKWLQFYYFDLNYNFSTSSYLKKKDRPKHFQQMERMRWIWIFFYEFMFANFQQSYGPWTLKISICWESQAPEV